MRNAPALCAAVLLSLGAAYGAAVELGAGAAASKHVWFSDFAPAGTPPSDKEVTESGIDKLLGANGADLIHDDDAPKKDLGEVKDVGPDTHESIDMLLRANNMEVHAEDVADNLRQERMLGEARDAAKEKAGKVDIDSTKVLRPIANDINSEIDALFSASIATHVHTADGD